MLGLGANKTGALNVESANPTIGFAVVTTADTPTASSSGTATLSGSYTGSGVTEVGFDFGVNVAGFSEVTGTDSSGTITANVSNLSSLTEYKYRAYAKNSRGKAVGSIQTFTSAEVIAAAGSPFHNSYGNTPLYDFEFNSTNEIYDFVSDFTGGNQFADISRIASITDENGATRQNVMKVQVSNTGVFGYHYAHSPNTELETVWYQGSNIYYKSYAVEMYVFIPSANSHINTIGPFQYGLGAERSFTNTSLNNSTISEYGASDAGSWKRVLYGTEDDFTTEFGLRTRGGGGDVSSTYFGFGISTNDQSAPGDIIYVSDIKIYARETTVSS
jgi:hypothetical protein